MQRICEDWEQYLEDNEEIGEIEQVDTANQRSNVDQLLEFKKLLDAGAIIDEEYNLKKKELIGL